jgi:uncharacterized protein (TIGR02271 family)
MALRDTGPTGRVEQVVVAGLFKDCEKAEKAVTELKASGFSDSEIGVARSSGEAAAKHDRSFWDRIRGKSQEPEEEVHYTQANDFEDSLESGGMPTDQARYFASKLEPGGCLVTLSSGARIGEAIAILEKNGADVGGKAAEYRPEPATTAATAERRVQLLGEMLRIHKERVNRGEVRLRKEVVTEERNVSVPVTREEVVIERVPASSTEPVSREIMEEDKDKEIRIPLTEEQVKVDKETGVIGEVRVGKRVVQETKNVSGEVRHEEVEVEKEGNPEVTDRDVVTGRSKERTTERDVVTDRDIDKDKAA